MSSSDFTVSIIIVLTFIILYLFNFFVVGYKQIKDNWAIYRCNPMVMPFAGLFGFNAAENFSFCIQNMQSAFMGELLKPVNYNLGALNSVGGNLTGNISGVQGMFAQIRNAIQVALQSVFSVFLNMMIEMQRIMMNVKDIMGKLMGAMSTSLYMLSGSLMTMNSAWDGPPGGMVRFLCFHPDTLIEVVDNKSKDGTLIKRKIKDLALNMTLKTGTRVLAVMHLSNVDSAGKQVETMYRLPSTNDNGVTNVSGIVSGSDIAHEDILVSGSHLVYDPLIKQFVAVESLAAAQRTDTVCEALTCLITSDHTIPIGQYLFHDWEDNHGSPAKNISTVHTWFPIETTNKNGI